MFLLEAITSAANALALVAPLTLFSRAVVAAVWFLALGDIWKHRDAPMANQAMAAALALIIGQFALIFNAHIPPETLYFFLAMANVVMATAVMRIFRWTALIPGIHSHMQEAKTRCIAAQEAEGMKAYGRSFVVIAVVGIAYFLLSYMEIGHIG